MTKDRASYVEGGGRWVIVKIQKNKNVLFGN